MIDLHVSPATRAIVMSLCLSCACGGGDAATSPFPTPKFGLPCKLIFGEGDQAVASFEYSSAGLLTRTRVVWSSGYNQGDERVLDYARDARGQLGKVVMTIKRHDRLGAQTYEVQLSPFCRQMPWAERCLGQSNEGPYSDEHAFSSCDNERTTCRYDAHDRLLEERTRSEDGESEYAWRYEYDTAGRLLTETSRYDDYERLEWVHRYDDKGRISRSLFFGDGEDEVAYAYTGPDDCLSSATWSGGSSDLYVCGCSPVPSEREPNLTPIADIQSSATSLNCTDPGRQFVDGADGLLVEGVVIVGKHYLADGLDGYVISDGTTAPYSAILVAVPSALGTDLQVGEIVRVHGRHQEFFCNTQLSVTAVEPRGFSRDHDTLAIALEPGTPVAEIEQYEGMLLALQDVEALSYDPTLRQVPTSFGVGIDYGIMGAPAFAQGAAFAGQHLDFAVGILRFSRGTYRISPRDAADIRVTPPPLRFRYQVDGRMWPSPDDIVLGEGLAVRISVWGGIGQLEPATISNATTSDYSVASVEATIGSILFVRARTAGRATLQVETTHGSGSIEVHVAPVATIDLQHAGSLTPDTPPSTVLVGGVTHLLLNLYGNNGQQLLGYGSFPIQAEPAGYVNFHEPSHPGVVPIEVFAEGPVTLTAPGDAPLSFEAVPMSSLTGIELIRLPTTVPPLVTLRGRLANGTKVSGVASRAIVTSATPDTCSVAAVPDLGEGVFNVNVTAPGFCRIESTWNGFSASYVLEP